MQKYHPDKFKGDVAEGDRKAREISEAYATLSDADKRAAYDRAHRQNSGTASRKTKKSGEQESGNSKADAPNTPPGDPDHNETSGASDPPPPPPGDDADQSAAKPPALESASLGYVLSLAAVLLVVIFGGSLAFMNHGTQTSTPTDAAMSSEVSSSAPDPKPDASENQIVSWSAKTDGDPKVYHIGNLTLTLSSTGVQGSQKPTLHVQGPGSAEFNASGSDTVLNPSANIGVGKLDPEVAQSQVLIATFTGGAHCCVDLVVWEYSANNWTPVSVGSFDGDVPDVFPKDVDGDGIPDFVEYDNQFLYAFTNYAQSMAPPQIFNVTHGHVENASASPRYSKLYRADLKRSQAECSKHNNGGCAAFVADAARLGLYDWAWRVMLTNYDATSNWEYPAHCTTPLPSGVCPDGQSQKFGDFPSALQSFLVDAGYTKPAVVASVPAASDPSFDCSRVESANLKLICNNSDLALADRQLAATYKDAMARSSNPSQLQKEEQQWINRRNAVSPNVDIIKRMYFDRTNVLNSMAGVN
jgi:uncharacterized protein YecT (DUF1311 family)